MAGRLPWTEAVLQVLMRSGGRANLKRLYDEVPRIKETDLGEKDIMKSIRRALDGLKNQGRVENVDRTVWSLKR